MGSFPLGKTTSNFDPKLLQIGLVSEISVTKRNESNKKSSISILNTHQIEHIPKNGPNLFINFLCSKFDALQELSLDDELDDGKPIEIRKINIDKKVFPKKRKHVKFSKIKDSNKHLNIEKIKKSVNQINVQSSCKNVIKRKFYNLNNLKKNSNSDKNNSFILHEGSFKSLKKTKLNHHKKNAKSTKTKDYKNSLSLSTIKSKISNCDKDLNSNKLDEQTNVKESFDLIRSLLKEMEN